MEVGVNQSRERVTLRIRAATAHLRSGHLSAHWVSFGFLLERQCMGREGRGTVLRVGVVSKRQDKGTSRHGDREDAG